MVTQPFFCFSGEHVEPEIVAMILFLHPYLHLHPSLYNMEGYNGLTGNVTGH